MLSLANILSNGESYTVEQFLLENLVNRLQSSLKASNNTIYPRWCIMKTFLKSNLTTNDTNLYSSCQSFPDC